jgi:sorbitol/mannitol transport system substrate-binding protein
MHEPRSGSVRKRSLLIAVVAIGVAAAVAATASARPTAKTISVAIVANPQMQDIASLTPSLFTAKSGIKVKYTILDEGKLREVTTRDVGSGGKAFDAVMIGPYEAPQFGTAGLLRNLTPMAKADKSYNYNDLIPAVRNALSARGQMYASPFYGESSFLMYRKDVLAKAGVKMPLHPTWDQVATIARKINTPSMAGICLRGKPGWGDLGASFTTVLNTFGGTWWSSTASGQPAAAQVDQPAFKNALDFYAKLVQDAGEQDAANSSFNECLAAYQAGKVAMWYDATVAAGLLEAANSPVKGKNGYAFAPVDKTKASGWLWTWALAIPKSSPDPTDAWKVHLMGDERAVHQGSRNAHEGRLAVDPAGDAAVHVRPSTVQGGGEGIRGHHAGRDEGGADHQPGHDEATWTAGGSIRRDPAVPGCRQPLHAAVLVGDRRLDEGHRRDQPVPADRVAGDQVALP